MNPAVLIVDDDRELLETLVESLHRDSRPVLGASGGADALRLLDEENVGLVVSDLEMRPMNGHELIDRVRRKHPGIPAVMMTAHGTIERAVEAMRNGLSDYLVKPFELDSLEAVVEQHLPVPTGNGSVVAADAQTVQLLRIASRVAKTDVAVMLSGESGSGKEVFARHLHNESRRSEQPFVAINCAAIPDNMLEAVLFGYEKGSFTGATSARPGKFEQAQGGTLLLDEISEMDLALQAKLLRVLQEKEVERIGGREPFPLDVRILATTNRNLLAHVGEGRFREDLYYRLNVFPLHIPPLRDRPGDILPLARYALRKHGHDGAPTDFDVSAADTLVAYRWPGNVRELENVVQRSLVLADGPSLTKADLVMGSDEVPTLVDGPPVVQLHDKLKVREYRLILDALQKDGGDRRSVAERLGISPRTLRYKLARMRDEGLIQGSGRNVVATADGGLMQ